jgi:hypothetical protein
VPRFREKRNEPLLSVPTLRPGKPLEGLCASTAEKRRTETKEIF